MTTLPTPESTGLTTEAARQLLDQVGPNELVREKKRSTWALVAGQFQSPLIWLLLAASTISALLGDAIDAIAIAVILVLNAVVGLVQELRAEKAISALQSMTAPQARLLRDGRAQVVPAAQVVPGDVLLLEAGDVVPADGRLTDCHAFATNEAALTGESMPVDKSARPVAADAPLAERRDTVFMGTSVSNGTAQAQVFATGMKTELGRIAHLLASAQETETPLQGRLRHLGKSLLFLAVGVVAAVAVLGLLHGERLMDVFMSAVSLAVAAVPEGLPTIVTIALAIGVRRMAARNVLVRQLPAVESLGCATVICTDKTGTLTAGRMAVRELSAKDPTALLAAAAACCDAQLGPTPGGDVGDPTEIAILRAAAERGISREEIESRNPRVAETPFDSERKRMSIQRRDGLLYVKGAVEMIVARATTGAEGALETAQALAARGLRVLAVAVGQTASEEHLAFLGLIGLADPPRPEATAAVAAARRAGIRTVMITGDHPVTAAAIAREMGIVGATEADTDLGEWVHARATPEDKLTIVRTWKARGAVVAMTGDGVNDAPALREAHIGIAMGVTGTAVTREAADIVLADDNFASIVAGVREGRAIFENIRRSLLYLLGGNTGELAIMLGAAVVGLPLPLLPLQILWLNLVTDGLPALALVMEPPDPDVLNRAPRAVDDPMVGRPQWALILLTGALLGATVLGLFAWSVGRHSLDESRTLAFGTLVIGHTIMSLAFRNQTKTIWQLGLFTNSRLLLVIVGSTAGQVAITLLGGGRRLFHLAWPDRGALLLGAVCALIPVTLLELRKLLVRRRPAKPPTNSRRGWPRGTGNRPTAIGQELRP